MKLIKGDCLEKLKEIPDNSIDCIITDPPYYSTSLAFDKQPRLDFDLLFSELFRISKPSASIIMFSDFKLAKLITNRPEFRYELIWEKETSTGFLDCNQRPLRNHEYILVFCREFGRASSGGIKSTYNPQKIQGSPYSTSRHGHCNHYNKTTRTIPVINNDGMRYPKSVQKFIKNNDTPIHPTQKPLSAIDWLVKTYSNENDIILDPFMGSGTTGIACLNNNRSFVGIELDTEYFNNAKKRIDNHNIQKKLIE